MAFAIDMNFVRQTERKLGRKLPPGYVAEMCNDNGGQVEAGGDVWNLYPIFDDSDRKRLKRTCNDIIRETNAAKQWPDFPENALAIGGNGGGDQLVLLADSAESYASPIYWWDHETGAMNKVADDFDELGK